MEVNEQGSIFHQIKITGDLGRILNSILADADDTFLVDGEKISIKYGHGEKRVFLN